MSCQVQLFETVPLTPDAAHYIFAKPEGYDFIFSKPEGYDFKLSTPSATRTSASQNSLRSALTAAFLAAMQCVAEAANLLHKRRPRFQSGRYGLNAVIGCIAALREPLNGRYAGLTCLSLQRRVCKPIV